MVDVGIGPDFVVLGYKYYILYYHCYRDRMVTDHAVTILWQLNKTRPHLPTSLTSPHHKVGKPCASR
jgi:hypothetical protein